MRYSTTSGMILAAMTIGEAVAGPAHAHMHRHAHEKKDADWEATIDWNALGIDWSSAWAAGQHTSTSAAPVPTSVAPTTTAAAPAQTTSAATTDTAEGIFNQLETGLWNNVAGRANTNTRCGGIVASSGTQGVDFRGNYGDPYAFNMYLQTDSTTPLDTNAAGTNNFVNNSTEAMTINIWNKVGPPPGLGTNSGATSAPTDTSLTFVLQPGKSQIVVFCEDSQVAWAQATDTTDPLSGMFLTTWGEAQFGSVTGSGYDISAINDANKSYRMTITSSQTACESSHWANSWTNAWVTDSQTVGTSDGSCWVATGSFATLTTYMGGNSS